MSYEAIIRRLIPWVEYHQNRYARELDAVVKAGCRWLDLGAGDHLHFGWLGLSPEALVTRASLLVGCDLEVPRLAANVHVSVGVAADARKLPFADSSFDLVTANMVLEHLADPERVFLEIERILRPQGAFVFVTSNRRHPAVWLLSRFVSRPVRRALGRWTDRRRLAHVFETHYLANRETDIHRLAGRAGLHVRSMEAFPSYPILRRPALLVVLECLWIHAQRSSALRRYGADLVGTLEKC